MRLFVALAGLAMILLVARDLFETIVMPRRVARPVLLFQLVRRALWSLWRTVALGQRSMAQREQILGFYGPLSVLVLLGIWAVGLVFGYALLLWAAGSPLGKAPDPPVPFFTLLYFSGTTFFTLGLGDILPTTSLGQALTVLEAGTGLIALAMVISYLPTLYLAFSQREVVVSLLDAHAGSPPSAVELLRRHADPDLRAGLERFLAEWETWAAQLMETHLSYPILGTFRSQHDNQSWVGALTTILDACALIIAGLDEHPVGQARLTFAIARHAAVDLCQVYEAPPQPLKDERLTLPQLLSARQILAQHGISLEDDGQLQGHLDELRQMYEPYVNALAQSLLMPLPAWLPPEEASDNWRSTAWEPPAAARIL